jgi:hypothetical protein
VRQAAGLLSLFPVKPQPLLVPDFSLLAVDFLPLADDLPALGLDLSVLVVA